MYCAHVLRKLNYFIKNVNLYYLNFPVVNFWWFKLFSTLFKIEGEESRFSLQSKNLLIFNNLLNIWSLSPKFYEHKYLRSYSKYWKIKKWGIVECWKTSTLWAKRCIIVTFFLEIYKWNQKIINGNLGDLARSMI